MQKADSSNASYKVRNDSHRPVSRFSSVTSATPAKRITFFKSGDAQFSGVRMAIHKRSFKCFDALLDDLSQKVPLPFGVRTITTPKGTHSIQRLEQLEDGGCYLCSDRHYVKPIDVEAAGKRPTVWHHSHPHNTRKKPSRPEEPPTGHSGQHYHRHPKRIVLVKNNDPTVRRSIILSRRTARSLRVFMDEISELMQCHVRKLYTLDGRKIDSIQSLMQCPSVLVCVGRESFKPLLLENLKKNSEEKLPGMGTRSRSSICSEGHESKKNVNFGLETKKSIIHPRSDSSNRSTRFSLSSEKSYPNGLCMTPGQSGCVSTCPYTKDVILNDDIEKRVLVNKDGSLSVEMKVRFRLVNDETLQWSTEIKKSATTSNESSSVKEDEAHYLQGKAEYSDPDSNSACEAEESCAPKLQQKHVDESHCQNCCNHCQEYDIWKNPMHKDNGDNGGRKSSSSSASSHKIMHKKTSVDSVRTISRSSEEYTEHVVEKASCFQQTVEEGDTRVKYCAISRCCSRSEISGTASKLKSRKPNEDTCETNIVNMCHHNGDRKTNAAFDNPFSDLGTFDVLKATEDRPISAVSNSSKVLESLKEDQDDDYDDLPPSASRASEWSQSDNIDHEHHFACAHCYGSQASPNFHLSPRPPSKVSSCSAHSSKHKKYRSMYPTPDSAGSSASKVSSRPPCQCGAVTPGSVASDMQSSLDERIPITSKSSIVSNKSKAGTNSPSALVLDTHGAQACGEGTESGDRSKSAMSANTSVSGKSRNSTVCPYCSGCERSVTAVSRLSGNSQDIKAQDADKDAEVKSICGRSSNSHRSERSNKCTQGASLVSNAAENTGEPVPSDLAEAEDTHGRSESAFSGLSNPSATSRQSNKSNRTACGRSSVDKSMISEHAGVDVEERTKSAMSGKSASAKSKTNSVIPEVSTASRLEDDQKAEESSQDERAVSPLSHKSNRSSKSRSSSRSRCSNSDRTIIPRCNDSHLRKTPQDKASERGDSPVSTASASHKQEPETVPEPRVDSAMSVTSNSSSKHPASTFETSGMSAKSQDETMENDVTPVPTTPETKTDQDLSLTAQKRASSAMSNTSLSSKKSNKSSRNLHLMQENAQCTKLNEAENVAVQASDVEPEERAPSAMSAKAHSSTGSHRSHKADNNIPDAETTSQLKATSPVTENVQEGIDSERPTSATSRSSRVSVKSDACSERISKSSLKPTGQAKEDIKGCAQNTLTVSSPSPKRSKRVPSIGRPKSPVTTGSNERAPSGISLNSRASSTKSTSSKKCQCSSKGDLREADSKKTEANDDQAQRVASSLSEKLKSAKSPTTSPCGQSDEPPSPTSTASVSLGLGEEEKSDDLNERSISSMSQTLEEGKRPLERSTPEPAVPDHVADSSETKERAKSAISTSSAVSKNSKRSSVSKGMCKSPKRAISPASVGKPESVISTKSKAESKTGSQANDGNDRAPSASSLGRSACCKASQPQTFTENNNTGPTDKASTISGRSSKCSQNKTDSGKATPTETTMSKEQGPEKNKKASSTNLKIKESKIKSDCNSDASSVTSLKTPQKENSAEDKEEQTTKASAVMADVPQNVVDPSDEMPNKNVMPIIHLYSSGDSVLSHTLSAADLLREKVGNARPVSRGSNTSGKNCDLEEPMNTGSKCEKRRSSKQRKIRTSSRNKSEDLGLELMPSCLPNASPAEVINDWLKNIPIDGPMYEMEDEFNEEHNEAVPRIVTGNVEEMESCQKEIGELSESVMKMKEPREMEWAVSGDPVKEDNDVICNETQACNETSETNAANTDPSPRPKLTKREGLPKRCHSSVQVMKVLLSPKLDRCNSLPEVSPVYGRKLSTSAKGLLDCLANLQLIDSDPQNGKEDKYNEIISILQSLWISESEQDKHKIKDHCSAEDEFNPRSSSGVDVSSGSIGSGKGSINGGVEKSETAGRTAPVIEQEALQVQVDAVKEDEGDSLSATPESTDTSHVPSDPLTPDIAERVRCSPEDEKPEEEQQMDEGFHGREETAQSTENQKETNEAEFSNKSSGNDSNGLKSSTDKEVSPENGSSGMSTGAQRGTLTRRVSQDPDPVWVLSLLKKLEKQFMSHYANAMAEFKVKWDLDDSEMLDKMISELKDEVHKRIQSSINRELQKIQSRAGRTPRPPIGALSRDSTVQTEQRRRRLKVMRDKSINPSLSRSEDVNTASGTEYSDQRSDDEYCPCDACLKKKMASRAVQRAEALSLAPVMKDFDLRKILQKKKDLFSTVVTEAKLEEQIHLKDANSSDVPNNLDVVHEESEVRHDMKSEDKAEAEGTVDATKDENSEEEATPASENQDAGLVNGEGQGGEERLSDDGNKAEDDDSAEDGKTEKDEDRAEEEETETERVEEENVQEENETDDKGEEDAVDGEAEDAEDLAKEEDPSEKEAAEIEETGNEQEEETTKEGETGEEAMAAEEEEVENTEEKIETAEEDEVTEDGKGEETESAHALDEHETLVEAENEMVETPEDEAKDEVDATDKSEGGMPSEDDGGDNQGASSQAEDEAEDEADEDQAGTEQEGQQVPSLKASEEEEDAAEGEDHGSEEKHHNDIVAKSTEEAENQAEGPDHNTEKGAVEGLTELVASDGTEADTPGQACEENSGHRLIKQITKTSVESQPGSVEYATDQRVKAKLKDIHSFMESWESQEDSLVVITKQSPFTERRNVSSRSGNKEEVENEVIEWQVSPKRRTRSPARANKQRRPKDSDFKVDDLEF